MGGSGSAPSGEHTAHTPTLPSPQGGGFALPDRFARDTQPRSAPSSATHAKRGAMFQITSQAIAIVLAGASLGYIALFSFVLSPVAFKNMDAGRAERLVKHVIQVWARAARVYRAGIWRRGSALGRDCGGFCRGDRGRVCALLPMGARAARRQADPRPPRAEDGADRCVGADSGDRADFDRVDRADGYGRLALTRFSKDHHTHSRVGAQRRARDPYARRFTRSHAIANS